MTAEKYLRRLEANCSLLQVDRTPPPKVSNFYWKNDDEEKYKVFIPTPNRRVYYNLEEYEGDLDYIINDFDNGWTLAKKCVRLAVSETHAADQSFINHMEFLIANLSTWEERKKNLLSEIGGDVEYYDRNLYKYYALKEYLVDDIINVPMERRGLHANFRGTIKIHPGFDEANVIHEMNIGFELAAERFHNDQNNGVYAYGRNDHGFS